MALWKNQPNTYKHCGFIDIPEGDHRARICRVEVERFSGKKKCFEITLEVSGYHGKLWYHIWYDPERITECSKILYPFFDSFGIDDYDVSHYKKWIGADGAISVRHDYRGCEFEAKYLWCVYGIQKDKLPPWRDAPKELDMDFLSNMPF
jgi:hypothetical protein